MRRGLGKYAVSAALCAMSFVGHAQAQWMLIRWNIDDISIWFQHQPNRPTAFSSFRVTVGDTANRRSEGSRSLPLVAHFP